MANKYSAVVWQQGIKICVILFALTIDETNQWVFECEDIYKYVGVVTVESTTTNAIQQVDHQVIKYMYMDDPDSDKHEKTSLNIPQKCLFINYSNELCGGIMIKGQLMHNDLEAHEVEIITRDKEKQWGWRTVVSVQRQEDAVSYNDRPLHVYQMKFIKLYMFPIGPDGNLRDVPVDTSDWRTEVFNRFNARYAIVYADNHSKLTVAATCLRLKQPENESYRIEDWEDFDSYFKAGGFVAMRPDKVNDREQEAKLEILRRSVKELNKARIQRISESGGSSRSGANSRSVGGSASVEHDYRRLRFTKNLIDLWL